MTHTDGTILAEDLLLTCHDPMTGRPLADSTEVAVALAGAMGIDGKLFPELPRAERRQRMRAVVDNDAFGAVVRQVIRAIEGAMVAVMAAGAVAARS
ncbi:hypothetical protein HNR23_003707 [Nocardiopsis mwathae]|uniref:Uncharacterized protein n=1 Tax=Nocardiopsis mwathae TaxID=1472723 RepID=A0A7W9YKD4_9ACTN|nr:hypothetical protein [Nocardiopsis mwathae]MBB6173647.1 hypothetical protein [Nocardiopsis mwathae]